ncbi:MAG TPA: TolC family protein [Bacteroidia bacterium]|nr:TolC family protein [Bacteroidia bacterium]
MKKYFFITCILLVAQKNAFSQKVWTLKECVDYALQNNITIKQSEISSLTAQTYQAQSIYNLFPSLNGTGSYSTNSGRSVDPTSYLFTTSTIQSGNVSLNASVTVFNGFQLQNELKQSRLNYMTSKYDLEKIKDDISLNVAATYLQVLYSNEQLKASNDRLDALVKQKNRTRLLTDAGTLPAGSLLDAEAQVANEEYTKVTAENSLVSSYLSLTQLLNLDSIGDFKTENPKVEIPDQSILNVPVSEIYATALKTKPEIKSADSKVLSAGKGLAISRGGYFPRVSLFGSLSSSYSSQSDRIIGIPIFGGYAPSTNITSAGDTVLTPIYNYAFEKTPIGDQFDNNFYKSVGVSLNIPIFNGLSSRSSVKRAKLNYETAKYSAELARNTLYKSIQQAYADAVAALNKYKASEKSVDALTQSFNYTDKKFNAGLITSLDFLTARNNLTLAESNLLQAKYDFIFRLKVLDFYMGKPIVY